MMRARRNLGSQYQQAVDRTAITQARLRRAFKAWEKALAAELRLGRRMDQAMTAEHEKGPE